MLIHIHSVSLLYSLSSVTSLFSSLCLNLCSDILLMDEMLLAYTSGVGRLLHLPSAEVVSAQLGPMRILECNHKVTGNGYKAVDGCEVVNRRL